MSNETENTEQHIKDESTSEEPVVTTETVTEVTEDKPEDKVVTDAPVSNVDENYINPITKIEKLNSNKKDLDDRLVIPNATFDDIITFTDNIESNIKKEETNFNKDEDKSILLTIQSIQNTVAALSKTVEDVAAVFTSEPVYGDKNLGIRPLPLDIKGNEISGESALAKISSDLGIGEVTQIPLYHSGFWLTLKPIKNNDIVNLQLRLSQNQIMLGRETNGLVFSNYSVVLDRIIAEFIVDNIKSASIKIDPDADILDYIKIQDLHPLVNGLLYSMYPNGYPLIRPCRNAYIMNQDTKKPMCTHSITATIDFRHSIIYNKASLSTEHLKHMANRSPNSVSILEVEEYQRTLQINKSVEIACKTTSTDKTITVVLKAPSVRLHIDNGEHWINNVKAQAESIFTSTSDDDAKNHIVNTLVNSMSLGIYNTFVDSIITSNGKKILSREDIVETLNAMSGAEESIVKELSDGVSNYIDNNVLSLVAIEDYKCPDCGDTQANNNLSDRNVFKKFIPINVVEAFLVLCAFRVDKTVRQSIY